MSAKEQRIDHVAEAVELLQSGRDFDARQAGVHATLAVAEQLRVANRIALAHPMNIVGDDDLTVSHQVYEVTREDGKPAMIRLAPEIAAALGIREEQS